MNVIGCKTVLRNKYKSMPADVINKSLGKLEHEKCGNEPGVVLR